MPQCCVPLCLNRSEFKKSIHLFYRFPGDEEEKRKWLRLIRHENFTPNSNSRVCSWHFPIGKAAGPLRFTWTEGKTSQFPNHLKWRKLVMPTSGKHEGTAQLHNADLATAQIPAAMSVTFKSDSEPIDINSAAHRKAEGKLLKKPLTSLMEPLLIAPQLLTGLGKFVCSVCSETFTSLAQLARHVQFHDRDRPFPCAVCGKRFLSRSHHDEHQRVHTGERPFPCDRCERSFTTHHNRKRHQMIHDKEEAYRCTVCGVLFCQDHQLGNLSGIIHVLKQHESTKPGHVGVKTKIKLEPKSTTKQEENVKKKQKHKHRHSHLEDYDSRTSFHTDGSQVPNSKEARVPEALHRTTPGIKKIAYDMEVVL